MTRSSILALVLVPWVLNGGNGHSAPLAATVQPSAVVPSTQLLELPPTITFGPGQHRVGDSITPGRYFVRPASGCYWARRSGAGGTAADTIAFGFVGFDAAQWIVDVLAADYAFHVNDLCGTWSTRAPESAQASIPPGTWIVGQQVRPGTYSSSVAAGCYWERLADFAGVATSVIARALNSKSGTEYVTILANDAGFRTDAACGSWMPVAPSAPTSLRIVD